MLRPRSALFAGLALAAVGLPPTPAQKAAKGERPPEQPRSTATYDVGDLVRRPALLTGSGKFLGQGDAARRVELLVREIAAALDRPAGKTSEPDSIRELNGTRLVIRTSAASHAQVRTLLDALRRINDVAVSVKARLYEVDETVYARVRDGRRIPLDEAERQFLAGTGPKNVVFPMLAKQEPVLTGEEVKVDNGLTAPLLSRHEAVLCGPGPAQVRRGDAGPQAVLDGVSLTGEVRVSSDRRSVRMTLREKAARLQEVQKVHVPQFILGPGGRSADVKDAEAEVPFVEESAHAQVLEIPDGGSVLAPVHYRPRAAEAKGRRWVLMVTARIYVEEEERQLRRAEGPHEPVRLLLPRASAERWDDEVLFACDAVVVNDTGTELKVKSGFHSAFDGLRLVVLNAEGKRLVQQPYTCHQAPSSPEGTVFTLHKGKNAKALVFPVRGLPGDATAFRVLLVGAVPEGDYQHVLCSDAVPVTVRARKK